MSKVRFRDEKFRELVLYVAQRCFDDSSFGATKLNKILFFSDFIAYEEHGEPITGATYQRLKYGPAPRQLLPALRSLEAEGRAHQVARPHYGREQKRVVPLDDPRLDLFTGTEIALVDEVIEGLRKTNAVGVSEFSHRIAVGWRIAGHMDEIPYESVFLSSDSPSPRDLERGRELAEEHGWVATA